MGNRIKGITVEIGGDTTGLDKALRGVNSSITKTQSALNDVNKLLKLDPSNTVLVAQKQQLLSQAVSQTSNKLEALESAQEQVTAAFQRGDIGQDKYQAFQREVEETRGKLNQYKNDLSSLQTEQDRLSSNTARLEKLFSSTGIQVDDYADVLGSKLVSAIKNGTANSDQMKTAIEKIGKSATGGKADIRQLTDALDMVDDGEAIRNLIEELKQAGDAAQDTAEDVGQIAENTKGAALMQTADQLSAVGDKIQDIGTKAMDAYSETENAVTKVNAYFGETGQAAEESANVIKSVYSDGVGESMDSVADAVLMVKKNLGDLSETDLTNLTQQAITLDELYGIDMNETLRGVNSLMQQYGLTAQEAMDYIVVGTQNGLDKTNELGDNLSEYAGKFSQAGYSASEYFQLLDNGLKNGAYNLDKVNDAINEVTTRLVDGTIGESIGSFSTKTQELFTSWQNGGATQKQVIDSIVADIGNCTNQQEALNLAALAFGTMAEDGNLKFITSLTSVGSTYDSVKGSAQGMFDATTTPMQQMESNTRKLQQALVPLGEKLAELANAILPPLVSVITTIGEWFEKLPEPVQNFVIILGALLAAFTALTPVIAAISVAMGALNISMLPIIAVIAAVAAAIAGIIAIIQNWGAITQWFGELWNTICTGIGAMVDSLKAWFSNLWTHLQSVWEGICNVVQTAVMLLGSIIQGAIDIITLPFQMIWENCKGIVSSVWEGIKSVVSSAIHEVSSTISSVMGAIKNVISTVWNAISSKVSSVLNTIKTTVSTVFNAVKSVASTVWNGIKSVISSVVDGIKSKVSSVFNGVKSTVTSIFNGIKSTAASVWNGIKDAIIKPVEAAKNAVKGIIDKITGFFSGMKLELPKIKLPHFKISGKLSLSPPSVPHLSIDWYKEGGILTKPTVFGMNGSSLMAGGEAGKEAVLPLKGFYDQLEHILSSRMNTGKMEQYLAVIANNSSKGIYLEDGTLVGHLLPAIDSRLGQAQKLNRRLSL
ncbi:phage tail tape measure protein [[Ruminococcus] torques]|jgi:phage-related minor tail protein|uniref:phage tail tape measure protein n=1 Tax=[Ruminococcus] torques TaxID=33039 RepID=UPI001D08DC10|nr:phage tail tape measure protein [[Ruminococcus] torques]MCB6636243.1 phage tail tape measure protein [[Ruminococcus] torques]MCB7323615.1 phage tail tape measure protein [[Ruminococcus] torques]